MGGLKKKSKRLLTNLGKETTRIAPFLANEALSLCSVTTTISNSLSNFEIHF